MKPQTHHGLVLARDGTWRRPLVHPACPPHIWTMSLRTLIKGEWHQSPQRCSRCGTTKAKEAQ